MLNNKMFKLNTVFRVGVIAAAFFVFFPIVSNASVPTVDIKANGQDGTISVASGSMVTLTWISTDAITCNASGDWSGTRSLTGTEVVGPITGTRYFNLSCSGTDGMRVDYVQVKVTSDPVSPPTVDLKINGSDNPSAINSGSSANLSWTSTNATSCTASGAWSGTKSTSGSESTGSLSSIKTYNLSCTGSNGTTTDSVTISVTSDAPAVVPTAEIKANGQSGTITIPYSSAVTLTWTSANAATCIASGDWSGSKSLSGSYTTGALTSFRRYNITCANTTASETAVSTVAVYVQSAPSPTVDLKINGQNGPLSLTAGNSATLSWTSTNATSCTASGAWSGTKSTSGSESTGSLTTGTKTYVITCGSVSDSVTLNVNESTSELTPSVNIKANGQDGPITVASGSTVTLTWTSANAATCIASGDWSGSKSLSGSYTTGTLSNSYWIYNITCANTTASQTAVDSVRVNVAQVQAPTVDLKINSYDGSTTVNYNSSATLSWTSTNATSCTASGSWSGSKSTSGSESTGSLTSTRSYSINCTGSGGTATDSVTAYVNQPASPTVDLKVNGYDSSVTIPYNSSANLSWTSSNATSCTAYGNWTGSKGTSGSESTSNLTSSGSYSIVCSGTGGSATDSVVVNVESYTPTNHQPSADAGPDKTVTEGSTVILQGYGYDQDGDPLTYYWSCTGGALSSYTVSQPVFTAPDVYNTTTYVCTLTVSDGKGGSASDSTVVTVNGENVSVSLTANPSYGSSPLNNVSLTADVYGQGSGTINYIFYCNRSDSSTNISSDWSYRIDNTTSDPATASNICYYANPGTYTAKVIVERGASVSEARTTITVTGNNSPVVVDLKANGYDGPVTIPYNSSANLSWTSSNATSCTAYGNWTGIKSTWGSESTGNLTSTRTYTINCYGNGGSATDTVTVNVESVSGIIVTHLTKNMSDGSAYAEVTSADPTEKLEFYVQVTGNNSTANQNVIVTVSIPPKISYLGNLKVDGVAVSGDIVSGLNIGTLANGQSKRITFEGLVAGETSFVYGINNLVSTATAISTGSSGSDNATIYVQRKSVAGEATDIKTGISDTIANYLLIPAAIALALVFFLRKYLVVAEGWVEGKRETAEKVKTERDLEKIILRIKRKERKE